MICPENGPSVAALRASASENSVRSKPPEFGIGSEQDQMITCERCNTENLEGSQYCDECGAALGVGSRSKGPITGPTDEGDTPEESEGLAVVASSNNDAAPVNYGNNSDRAGEKIMSGDTGNNERRSEVVMPAARTSASGLVSPSQPTAIEAANPLRNGPHAKLVIHRGRSAGKEFPINDDEAHIGRWDADGGIFPDVDLDSDDPEAKVSRRHARITRRGGQYFIEDLGSTNGTFINRGRRLLPGDRQPLRDGDEVIVGKTFLRFHVIK
jgi:hypothetical protein